MKTLTENGKEWVKYASIDMKKRELYKKIDDTLDEISIYVIFILFLLFVIYNHKIILKNL